jgi:hypothetical protein
VKVELENAKCKWLIYRGKKLCYDGANLILLPCYISGEYHNHQDEGQQANGDMEEHEAVRACDVIRITGKRENCEAAHKALLDLVPVTVEVSSELTQNETPPLEVDICSCNKEMPFLLCDSKGHYYVQKNHMHAHTPELFKISVFLCLIRAYRLFPWGFPTKM